ncbi:MAG: glycoside hydrolase family 95 protein, partial [Clostridia bacterium]|nr:glycoside hydrolase family 95 protein [Clostridia bacterium]
MKNILFYKKKAKAWEEALPVGNGRIGAMVFGNLKTERIALNEDSLWSGYPKDLNKKDAGKYLEPLRKAILSGDHKTAKEIANRDFHGHWSEAYLPFGDLNIEYSKSTKKGYERTLNLENGLSITKSDLLTQTVFVSCPSQLLVVNVKANEPISARIQLFSKLHHKCYTDEDMLVIEGQAPEICMPPYYNTGNVFDYGEGGMRFAGAVKVLGTATFDD